VLRSVRRVPVEGHLGQADEAVVVGVPAVDDRRLAGVGALEEVEVVADELHLVEGLVDGHRRSGMLLLPHDPPGEVLVEVGDVGAVAELAVGGGSGREADLGGVVGHAHAGGGAPAVVHAAAVGRAAQAVVELGGGHVERRVEVGAVGLGPDDGTLSAEGDLHALAVGRLARVLLVEELHVHPQDLQLAVEAVDLTDLVLDVLAVVLGDFDVTTTDDDLHETSR
jgi:hypothetical protein